MFQFSRIDFWWDFITGRDQISVRLTLGLQKLPQASRSLLRARIREDVCPPRLCQTPPGWPDRVLLTPRPSRGVVSCVALGLPGHPPKGAVPLYPPRGVLREWSRPVPGSCRGRVIPDRGFSPHYPLSMREFFLPLFRLSLALVLLPVSADGFLDVERAEGCDSPTDDVLLRPVASSCMLLTQGGSSIGGGQDRRVGPQTAARQ